MWGETWAPSPCPCAPSFAYLPNDAIIRGGRWCLVWRGGKGHCDRGPGRPYGLIPPSVPSIRLLFCTHPSALWSPSLHSFLFSVPLSSVLPVSKCLFLGVPVSAASSLPWLSKQQHLCPLSLPLVGPVPPCLSLKELSPALPSLWEICGGK